MNEKAYQEVKELGCFHHFMLGAQTSGTQVEAFRLTIYRYRGRVYVRYPASVGMPFGMANVVTEHGGLTA